MTCEERLGQEYKEATERFSKAVHRLQLNNATTIGEYQRLRRASDEARMRSEQARLALKQHVAGHNCLSRRFTREPVRLTRAHESGTNSKA